MLSVFAATAAAQTETTEYYGLDALGSVRVIVDQNGQPIERMDYGPFGENLKASIRLAFEQYAQLARDAETGQDYAQARNYSSSTGRFNRVDPVYEGLFDPQRWNRYSYAVNSPLVWTDASGLNAARFSGKSVPGCETFICFEGLSWGWIDFTLFGGGGGSSFGRLEAGGVSEPGGRRGGGTGAPGESPTQGTPETPGPVIGAPGPPPRDAEDPKKDCPVVPLAPRGITVELNLNLVSLARQTRTNGEMLVWLYEKVRNASGRQDDVVSNRSWDYKQIGAQFEEFGNFNYGAAAQRVGIPLLYTVRGSYLAHVRSHGMSAFSPSNILNEFNDIKVVYRGYKYAKNHCS